jgi:hypothetical protein
MTDRDTFAAAALTGLLADQSLGDLGDTTLATRAYELASAMIEERVKWNRAHTLTDEEREAIETAMDGYIAWMDDNVALETPRVQAKLATLRNLLERLHT